MRVSELTEEKLQLAAKAMELYRQNSPKQVASKLGVSARYVRKLWERMTDEDPRLKESA